jgi:protein-tyrosine phosphatase
MVNNVDFSELSQDELSQEVTRLLKMEAIRNLRDVGGYKTADSRFVAWGKIYRSASLFNATENDIAHLLQAVGIRHVIDFRNHSETVIEPSPQQLLDNIQYHWLPIAVEGTARDDIVRHLQQEHSGDEDFSSLLVEVNRRLVSDHQPDFAAWFRILVEHEPPFLFHCTEGKDRTGFAAALLLSVLGVSREEIFNDYLLTNIVNAESIEERIEKSRLLSSFQINTAQLKRLLMAHTDYLQAAFSVIEQEYGSIDHYLAEAMGLTEQDKKTLREKFLR